jgi:acetyltransferase-like isoleucine patch superfamily enzyme
MPGVLRKLTLLCEVCGWPLALVRAARSGGRSGLARLQRPWWRFCLASLGPRTRIQRGVLIYSPRLVSLGADCLLARGAQLLSESFDARLAVGDRVQLNARVHIDYTGGLTLEDDVLISEEAMVYTHSHGHDPRSQPVATPLVVGQGAWIGARAIVLSGVARVGAGAIVGAGAVVTREVPAGAIVAGNPARVIGSRSAETAESQAAPSRRSLAGAAQTPS